MISSKQRRHKSRFVRALIVKKKGFIILIVVLFAALGYGSYRYYSLPDGSTVESREKMLSGTPKGTEWTIWQEQELENCLLSSIYSDTKSGIAVFQSTENAKYQLVSQEWRNSDEIVISGVSVEGEWYDLIWFNGAETDHAEVTYSVGGGENKLLDFDVSDMKIICSKAPAKEYTLAVKYYDNDGKVYE